MTIRRKLPAVGGIDDADFAVIPPRGVKPSRITVRHGDVVDAIQVDYTDLPGDRIGGSGGIPSVVELASDEKILEISGSYGQYVALAQALGITVDPEIMYIGSLTIRTNKHTHGPFGSNVGMKNSTPFSLSVKSGTDEYINGIFGKTNDSWIGALGAIIDRLDHPSELPTSTTNPVSVDDIEVTQTIQDIVHSVPLIAKKKTVARVYVSMPSSITSGNLSGEIVITKGTETHYVYSDAFLNVASKHGGTLLSKRETLEHSLNFMLPANCCSDQVDIKLNGLYLEQDANINTVKIGNDKQRTVKFEKAPPLRLRVIGICYKDGVNCVQPRSIDYKMLKSWLQRVYPVSSVDFSYMVTPAQHDFTMDFNHKVIRVNAEVAAIRNLDMANSTIDKRTHYLGLVLDERIWKKETPNDPSIDNETFMRGSATDLPTNADPTAVASGPTGKPLGIVEVIYDSTQNWVWGNKWDKDPSYGDYYNGHELGHTFGRHHAGYPKGKGGQIADPGPDGPYPYDHGQIGDNSPHHDFLGMDVGDEIQDGGKKTTLPMQSLPFSKWFDVMTYCDYEWISDFTYKGILKRIREEDKLKADGTGPGGAVKFDKKGKYINIICRQDEIHSVNMVSGAFIRTAAASDDVQIWVTTKDESGTENVDKFSVRETGYKWQAGKTWSAGNNRFIDAMIELPLDKEVQKLELRRKNKLMSTWDTLDTWAIKANASAVDKLTFSDVAGERDLKKLTWSATVPVEGKTRYNVQMSTDGGTSWFTHTVGLENCETEIDVKQFKGKKVKVRVVAANGVSEKPSAAKDLPVKHD